MVDGSLDVCLLFYFDPLLVLYIFGFVYMCVGLLVLRVFVRCLYALCIVFCVSGLFTFVLVVCVCAR